MQEVLTAIFHWTASHGREQLKNLLDSGGHTAFDI
jgi:hypothetical protein